MTAPTKAALRLMSRDPDPHRRWNASQDRCQAEVSPGSIHNLLGRLVEIGWLVTEFEDIDEAEEGRRARRLYWFSETGLTEARQALAESDARMPSAARPLNGLRQLPEQA